MSDMFKPGSGFNDQGWIPTYDRMPEVRHSVEVLRKIMHSYTNIETVKQNAQRAYSPYISGSIWCFEDGTAVAHQTSGVVAWREKEWIPVVEEPAPTDERLRVRGHYGLRSSGNTFDTVATCHYNKDKGEYEWHFEDGTVHWTGSAYVEEWQTAKEE